MKTVAQMEPFSRAETKTGSEQQRQLDQGRYEQMGEATANEPKAIEELYDM